MDEGRFDKLFYDFGLISTVSDRTISKFIADSRDFGNSLPMDAKIQALAGDSYGTALEVSERAFRLARIQQGPKAVVAAYEPFSRIPEHIVSGHLSYDPRNRARFANYEVSLLNARRKSGLVRQLNVTSSGHLLESYQLDRGIPIPRTVRTHVAVAEHADEVMSVRSRTIHTVAFAGVAVVPTQDPLVVEQAIQLATRPTFMW
ncbi:MAG TPA: hypothetical protein VF574_10975 [Allosphingosinicella sp.]|jgi:hypothetical protein